MSEICTVAEVQKGSFYHFFDSKHALTLEALDAHWAQQRAGWESRLDGHGFPLERLGAVFGDTVQAQRRTKQFAGTVQGCAFANLALELSGQEPAIQARLQEVFDQQIVLVKVVLAQAAAVGEIPAENATAATARALVAQIEGMVLLAKLGNDLQLLDDLWGQARQLLGAAPLTVTA